jgi:gluconolactonase
MGGWGLERPCELDVRGEVPPGGCAPELLVADLRQPNGLCFSPDEAVLYIDDMERVHVRSFEVLRDGSLGRGSVLRAGIGDPARPDEADPPGSPATSTATSG